MKLSYESSYFCRFGLVLSKTPILPLPPIRKRDPLGLESNRNTRRRGPPRLTRSPRQSPCVLNELSLRLINGNFFIVNLWKSFF